MLKKIFVAITLVVCVAGLTFSSGCGGPGEVQKGAATQSDFGNGKSQGKTENGDDLPEGVIEHG